MGSGLTHRGAELGCQFFSSGDARCGHTEPFGDGDEVDVGARQIEQGLRLRARSEGADALQFLLQDRVCQRAPPRLID
jgi:hypothetical protein